MNWNAKVFLAWLLAVFSLVNINAQDVVDQEFVKEPRARTLLGIDVKKGLRQKENEEARKKRTARALRQYQSLAKHEKAPGKIDLDSYDCEEGSTRRCTQTAICRWYTKRSPRIRMVNSFLARLL